MLALHKFHISGNKYWWIRIAAFFIIIFYCIDLNSPNTWFNLILATCSTFISVLTLRYFSKKRFLNAFRSTRTYQQDVKYTFFRDHYELVAGDSFGSVTWASRRKVMSDSTNFYIYHSNVLASVIPKKYMTTEEMNFLNEVTAFKNFV